VDATIIAASAGDADCVAFLHGLASNRTRWSELVERMSAHAGEGGPILLTPDLFGHGQHAVAGERGDLARWCADLALMLDQNGSKQAAVVGHSLGAQVALHFAAAHPDRVQSLFLIDPVLRSALLPRNRWLPRVAPLFAGAAALIRLANRLGIYRHHLAPLDLRELDRVARIALATPANTEAFIRQYSSTRADLRHIHSAQYLQDVVELLRPPPDLTQLRCPVRVLLSTGATFASADATREQMSVIPKVSFASIDCHHWPVTERPDEVRTAIERWLGSQD